MQVFSIFVPQLRAQGNLHIHPKRPAISGFPTLSDDGAGSSGLVLPGRGEDTDGLVVAGKTVDSGLDENETELGVLVLSVALKMLADGNSLISNISILDHWKKVFLSKRTFLMSM